MPSHQDIELKSPAEAILKAYDSSTDGVMSVPERLGLVETKRRTVAEAAGEVRALSAILSGAVANIPADQQIGLESWRDIIVAIQNVVLLKPSPQRTRARGGIAAKAFSTPAMKDLADLTWQANEPMQNLPKAIGKMFLVMGFRVGDFTPKAKSMSEFRNQVVTLTEEYFYEHLFNTPARKLVFRTLPHITLFKSLTHRDSPIPHNFLHAIMTGNGVARASSKIASGNKPTPNAKAYFALMCQTERLLNRMVRPDQQTAITQDKWNAEIVDSVGVGTQAALKKLFKKLSDAMVAEKDPIESEEDADAETNGDGEETIEDLWVQVSPPKPIPASTRTEPNKRQGKKRKPNPETEERTEERRGNGGAKQLVILDVTVDDMQMDQSRCQEWVSQQNEEVYLKYRFRDELEPVIGKITSAKFNKNAGYAKWTVTMNDTREASLDISEVISSVKYYQLWREGERARGADPEQLMRDANKSKPQGKSSRAASKKSKTGKASRSGIFNVKMELRKLNQAEKKDLDKWLEDIDASAPGYRFVDSDASDEDEDEADEIDHTDITQTYRGERFKLLRDAAQTPATNNASIALRGNTRISDKCEEVNSKCRSECSLDLPHEVILSIVFGANKRLPTFAALIGMGTDISEEADSFGVDQLKDVVTQTPTGGWIHTTPTRDLRKKKNLDTVQDCLEATMFFEMVLNSWHSEAWGFTHGLPLAMQRTITKSKNSLTAALSLLQTMWITWCSSIDRVISLATRGDKKARNGFYVCDMALHHRCHLVVLKGSYWTAQGAEECRIFLKA